MTDPQGWTAGPALEASAWTPGPAPTFTTTNEPPSPSMWERANTPLIPQIADAANAIADHLDKPRVDRSALQAQLEGFVAGATQGAGKVLGGFTSPLGLALTVAGLGPGGVGARSIPMVGRVLALPAVQALQTAVRIGAGGAVAAHGVGRVATAADAGDVGQGLTEIAGGALGMAPAGRALAAHAPSGPQLIKGAITAGKLIKSPVRTTIGIIADELSRRQIPPESAGHVSAPGYPRETSIPAPVAPPPPAAAPAAAVTPTEFQAAQAARQANALPDQAALNAEAIARRRAAYQASQASAPAAEPVAAASGQMKLTVPEFKEFQRLVAKKVAPADALEQVKAMRELATRFGLSQPTAADTRFPKGARR